MNLFNTLFFKLLKEAKQPTFKQILTTLLNNPNKPAYIYKDSYGFYQITEETPKNITPIGTLKYTQRGIEVQTNNPAERSKIMHLLRYKDEDHSEDNKPLVKTLSDITVQTLTNNLSKIIENSYTKNIEKNLQKLIFIYPNSRSPFNNNVSQQLLKKYPNIRIISLNKNTLKDIPPNKLFPLKNISLSDTQLRLQWILNPLYENYRKLYPDQPFSRETLSKDLRKFFTDSLDNNNIKIQNSKTDRTLTNLIIFNYTLPIQHKQRDIQRLKDSNSFYDISENIIKQNTANIFNTQNLENIKQPGDVIIAFDDNTGTKFTADTIENQIRNLGLIWGGIYFGATFDLKS